MKSGLIVVWVSLALVGTVAQAEESAEASEKTAVEANETEDHGGMMGGQREGGGRKNMKSHMEKMETHMSEMHKHLKSME